MKIELKKFIRDDNGITLEVLFERSNGGYNNALITHYFIPSDVEGYTNDEIVTRVISENRYLVVNCFNRVEEWIEEEDEYIGFEYNVFTPEIITVEEEKTIEEVVNNGN